MDLSQNIKEKPTPSISRKIDGLLAKMSIEEKAGQITQIALDLFLEGEMYKAKTPHQIDPLKLDIAINQYKVGSVLNAVQDKIGAENVVYASWSDQNSFSEINTSLNKYQDIDHIFLCLGEEPYTEFHGNIDTLDLPETQIKLAKAAIATGKPLTLILLQGKPRVISKVENNIKSILLAYLPGNEGAYTITDILFGDSESVHFRIVLKDLEFVGRDNKWISEPGKFSVFIGNQSAEFELIRA